MRFQPTGHASVVLISLAFLLATPNVGASQDAVPSGLSADRPLSHALSSISWFSWNGIWVRSNGMWAWRPTVRPDWQAYFRCQSGNGCGGLGPASNRFWNWLPGRNSSWDLVPGGWMWFPGQRFAGAWDLWFLGPRHGFGTHGFDPRFSSSFPATGWGGGLTTVRTDPSYVPTSRPDRDRQANSATGSRAPDGVIRVDPVRSLPVVALNSDGEDRASPGRSAPTKASIDRVRLDPRVESPARGASDRSARQELKGKSGGALILERNLARESNLARKADLRRFTPAANPSRTESRSRSLSRPPAYGRDNLARPSRVPSATSRLKSPRTPAAGTRTNGRPKSTSKTVPKQ